MYGVYKRMTFDCHIEYYGRLGKVFRFLRKKKVLEDVSNADFLYEHMDLLRLQYKYCNLLYLVKKKEEDVDVATN